MNPNEFPNSAPNPDDAETQQSASGAIAESDTPAAENATDRLADRSAADSAENQSSPSYSSYSSDDAATSEQPDETSRANQDTAQSDFSSRDATASTIGSRRWTTPSRTSSFGQSASTSSMDRGSSSETVTDLEQRIANLQRQERDLKQSISNLQSSYQDKLQAQIAESQSLMKRLLRDGLADLEQRRNALRLEVEQLERRQGRIQAEMRKSFAGASQDLAIRVQGFKDYLVGSLQDLAIAAEQLELAPPTQPRSAPAEPAPPPQAEPSQASTPQFAEEQFQQQNRQIRALLDQYRSRPDYYGPPWQLRRTFEPVHAERIADWFFKQGGRGAIRSMGSRLQNILVASAAISILKHLYRDRVGILILIDSPERLGEWRRGLQDCLGVARMDFNIEQGIVLFEAPEPLSQRAERMLERGLLPLIVVDESENQVDLSILQFPLWLAFAPNPPTPMGGYGDRYSGY